MDKDNVLAARDLRNRRLMSLRNPEIPRISAQHEIERVDEE